MYAERLYAFVLPLTVSCGRAAGETVVKNRNITPERPADASAAAAQGSSAARTNVEDGSKDARRADALLAKRCLAGEVAAWEEFYAQCHDPLCLSIKVLLGRTGSDASLVDEIAAKVWYALVANDGELLSRYNPRRKARLITFMRALAKDEISRHFRSEVRRRERELVALRERPQYHGAELEHSNSSLSEFLGTLTLGEREFCGEYLLAPADEAGPQVYSSASIWQFTRRIYRKLTKFLAIRP
jgi:hypothetical protein